MAQKSLEGLIVERLLACRLGRAQPVPDEGGRLLVGQGRQSESAGEAATEKRKLAVFEMVLELRPAREDDLQKRLQLAGELDVAERLQCQGLGTVDDKDDPGALPACGGQRLECLSYSLFRQTFHSRQPGDLSDEIPKFQRPCRRGSHPDDPSRTRREVGCGGVQDNGLASAGCPGQHD